MYKKPINLTEEGGGSPPSGSSPIVAGLRRSEIFSRVSLEIYRVVPVPHQRG